MSQRMTVNYNRKPCYDIVFETSFDALGEELDALDCKERKLCIVTDSNVGPIYAKTLKSVLESHCKQVEIYEIPAGEVNKNLDQIRSLLRFLIESKFIRRDMLVALGGGVVGDMTGFAAATYLRGIDFIQIPTTLLAQADSSIGGKTGVDFDGYKNMVGAFKMPRLVYMNFATLATLPARQYFSGFAEVMKYGLIKDDEFYVWLIDHIYEIGDLEVNTVGEMLIRSCNVKRQVVEKDPTEKGDRALLNFGHTLGHAIEKTLNFEMLHGECVALGSVCAAFISWKKGYIKMEDYYEIRDMFVPFHLPISLSELDKEAVILATKSDKKAESGFVKFVLLKKIGKAFIDTTVTDEEMMAALNELVISDED